MVKSNEGHCNGGYRRCHATSPLAKDISLEQAAALTL
jgi:hypothetical protein